MRKQLQVAALAMLIAACGAEDRQQESRAVEESQAGDAADAVSPHPPESLAQSVDGVDIRYDDRGQGSPALVLVHGWSCDRGYWREQQEYFAATRRVVSIDLAGHGASGAERETWTMENFGHDVVAVVDQLGLDEVVLVGHSMGGPVVLEAARLLGDRVVGVIGADTLRNVGQETPQAMVDEFFAGMEADFAAAVAGIVSGGMFVEGSDARLKDFVVRDMASAPPEVGKQSMRALLDYDPLETVAGLSVPLTLINSDYQPNVPEPLETRMEDFELVEMSGVGHFVMMEDADTFNGHVASAIERFQEAAR